MTTDVTNFADDDDTTADEDFDSIYNEFVTDVDVSRNLVDGATLDCLYGDCEHFCGEPTEADLDYLRNIGYDDEVERYVEGINLV